MFNHLFTNQLYAFEQELLQHVQEDKEKELRILFALSDLLPESSENNNCRDYIQTSLQYLKHHYGLSKSAWLALLMLNEKIPYFTEKLSCFDSFNYQDDYSYQSVRDRVKLNHICPVDSLPFIKNQRHYHIQKLFTLLSDLSAHFGLEGACKYIGLFGFEFDTRESCFSILRLRELNQQGYENLTSSTVHTFWNRFEGAYCLPPILRNLSWYYSYVHYQPDFKVNIRKLVSHFLDFIKVDTTEPMVFFFDVIYTYQKYTHYSFLSFDGLLDIQSQKIEHVDAEKINFLLQYFGDYKIYHQAFQKVTIELVRLISRYEHNFDKGLDKLTELTDYMYRSTDFKTKLIQEKDLSLTRLLQWSNQWHIKGESRGEFKPFSHHAIDLILKDYRFEQIKNNYELHEEGQKQSHCVYSYEKDCLEGKAIIVSMKDMLGKRVATLRFQKKTQKGLFEKNLWFLAEKRKRFNRNCTPEETLAAQCYFDEIKHQLKS